MSSSGNRESRSEEYRQSDLFEMSLSTNPSQSPPDLRPPVNSDLAPPTTASQGAGSGGGIIRKLSKKEKRFHLARDDGKYAELNPISPLEAKREYGDTLKLNPVGPAFVGVAKEGVVTSHNTVSAVPGPEEGKCLGNTVSWYNTVS